jgi:hypothetical protein
MKSFFEGIQYLFEQILFVLHDYLRNLELSSWWLANIFTWIFIIIGIVATFYWLNKQMVFTKSGEDEQDTTAHSFL